MNIGIIGGSDGLGKTLIYHLKDEFNVAFSGRDHNKGMKVGSIPEVLYYHRWHAGSAGQNQKTIDMMRDLVKKNFAKLDVKLTCVVVSTK